MLNFLLWAYYYGGFAFGLSLIVSFFINLAHRKNSAPWAFSLGLGWLLFVLGLMSSIHAQLTLQRYHTWRDGWGILAEIGVGFWWITLLIYLTKYKLQRGNSKR